MFRCLSVESAEESATMRPKNDSKPERKAIDKNPYKKNSSGKSAVAYLIAFRNVKYTPCILIE